jgi:hypothetical protein
MGNFTLDTTLGTLLANPTAKAVLDQYVPGMSTNPMVPMISGMSLRAMLSMPQAAQMGLTEEKVETILAEINKKI